MPAAENIDPANDARPLDLPEGLPDAREPLVVSRTGEAVWVAAAPVPGDERVSGVLVATSRVDFPPDRLAVAVVSAVEVVEQGSLLVVLLGLPLGNPAALYVTALISNICQAGFIFVRFIDSAFRHEVDEDSTEGE